MQPNRNPNTGKDVQCKQNAASEPGVITRARKYSRCGGGPENTCVTGEHLCNTGNCATMGLMQKAPMCNGNRSDAKGTDQPKHTVFK